MRRSTPLGLVLLCACAPQSAVLLDGDFTAFLALNTSATLATDAIDLSGAAGSTVTAIDCRELQEGQERLPGALDVCNDAWPPTHERWLARDAFYVYSQPLDPWRGEAIMTSEGDFQISFHQHLAGGEDFRFAFVIDPNFAPQRCVEGAGGEPELAPVDGDWLEHWSDGVDGTRWFLNAYSYQFNPANTCSVWSLPEAWRAGYTAGKFGGDLLYIRAGRYGMPAAYSAYEFDDASSEACPKDTDLWFGGMKTGDDPMTNPDFLEVISTAETVRDEDVAEFGRYGATIRPVVHTNQWRAPDDQSAGLDGWVEMHYNWVRLDPGYDLRVGGYAKGEFELVLESDIGDSKFLVHGSFETNRIGRDKWASKDIEAIKLRENGTVLCGQAAP